MRLSGGSWLVVACRDLLAQGIAGAAEPGRLVIGNKDGEGKGKMVWVRLLFPGTDAGQGSCEVLVDKLRPLNGIWHLV